MRITAIFILAMVVQLANPAYAIVPIKEIRGGITAQGCCGQGVEKEQGAAINVEAVFKSPRFLSVLLAPRPVIGATVAFDSDATSQIYAGLDWRFDLTDKFFVTAGGGGAIHNGETDAFDPVADQNRINNTVFLGCRALFRMSADIGYQLTERVSASLYYAHISNAGLCDNNEGLDQLGVRFGWTF